MKRPSSLVYLFGNPFVSLVLMLAALWLVYAWWAKGGSGALALAVAVAASYAAQSAEQLQKYQLWQREWDAMEGRTSPPSKMGWHSHRIIGIAIFCVAAIYAFSTEDTPEVQIARVLFVLAGFAMVAGLVIPRIWRRRGNRARKIVDVPVTQHLKSSARGEDLRYAYSALPTYCVSLLRQR
jgi:hypothetical protein